MTVHSIQQEHLATAPVFISGSRSIKRLPAAVLQRLSVIVDRGFPILIGDAGGADCAIQRFLADHDHNKVTVFCAAERPRNNVGHWPVERVATGARQGTVAFHAGKDREMARRAVGGFVLWDGCSRGSLANIHRLCARGCYVVIYMSSSGQFVTLRSMGDREELLARYPIGSS